MEELLLKYFNNLDKEKIDKYNKLIEIIEDWNNKINLISRKEDREQIKIRHILHSLSIAKLFNFEAKNKIIDIGTGGGFPGIPLAIIFPETNFYLVDSITKKINVVNDIIDKLKLKNVRASACRAENIKENFDIIISRAVTQFPVLFNISKGMIKKDQNKLQGIICLKGGDLKEELKEYKNIKIYSISNFFNEEYFETKKIVFLRK